MGIVTWLLLYLSEPLFYLAGLSESVCRFGYGYLLFRIVGLFGVFWYWTYNAYMEGIGDTRTPMVISLMGNGINIALDYILIFGIGPIPAMGGEVAGLATALSNLFMFVCFVVVIHRQNGVYRLPLGAGRRLFAGEWRLLRKMFNIGLPMGVQFFMGSIFYTCDIPGIL